MSHPDPLARISWAYKQEGLSGPAKAVLAFLAYADGPQGCFPSIPTICKETGFGRTAVRSALKLLTDTCLIEVAEAFTNNRQTSNSYVLDYMHMRTGEAAHPKAVGGRETTPRGSADDPSGGRETTPEHEEELEVERGSDTEVSDTSSTTGLSLAASAVGASAPPLGGVPGEGDLRSPSSQGRGSGHGSRWATVHQLPIQDDEEERLPDPWASVLGGSDTLRSWGYR